ncbi:MAG: hypothetical protein V3T17_05385 [Pseudomonadales bacterium]
MRHIVTTAVILLATSSLSYGRCTLDVGAIPSVPDAQTATLQEMLEARNNVSHYVDTASDFIICADGSKDRRTPLVLEKIRKLAKNFNHANKVFSSRVAKDPSLLYDSNQKMVAQY